MEEYISAIDKALLEMYHNDETISDDNIFSILGKEWDERTHCRILFFLIKHNPEQFSKLFGGLLDGYTLLQQESCCEFPCHFIANCQYFTDSDKRGFIDILLIWENKTNEKIYMPIEAKLGADDQPLQLLRYYYQFSHNSRLVHPVYLTPSGKRPSRDSTICKHNDKCECDCPKYLKDESVICKSFQDIEKWLKNTTTDNPLAQEIIKNYCEILTRWYKMDKYIEYIKNTGKEAFISAKNIYNSFGGMVEEIRKTFFKYISECVEQTGGSVKINYSDGAQEKEAGNEGWHDAGNTMLVLQFDNEYLSVCVGTNLYCRRNKGCEADYKKLDEWCYIIDDWFNLNNVISGEQTSRRTINCRNLSEEKNFVVEWYFDKDTRDQKIRNLVTNLRRYAKHEMKQINK